MDDKRYGLNDMVRAGCGDCKGCSECCRGMGQSILLDPYDIWQLETNLGETFGGLLREKIELHVEDGLILPNLKMKGAEECCGFLNQEGRCGIHAFRPGLCRLFPLGRQYEGQNLQYFLLENACPNGQTKVRVRKWLEIQDSRRYTDFLIKWHDLRKRLQAELVEKETGGEEPVPKEPVEMETAESEHMKEQNMRFLHIFYEEPYGPEEFYGQFEERLSRFEG